MCLGVWVNYWIKIRGPIDVFDTLLGPRLTYHRLSVSLGDK